MRRRLIIDVKPVDQAWRVEWRGMGRHTDWPIKRLAVNHAQLEATTHELRGGLAQIVVFKQDGRFQYEATYGADPRRRVG